MIYVDAVRMRARMSVLALLLLFGGPLESRGAEVGPGTGDAPAERVLLVTIDTLRRDHVGAYGGPVATPVLDRLAAEGVLLEDACTPIATTGPAHASLFTGLHPWRHGTLKNAVPLDPRIATLADRLSEAGVPTAAFVSSFVLDRRFGFHQGFDHFGFEPTENYAFEGRRPKPFWTRAEATTQAAMRWLTEHGERPFFLWVHYFDPHTPYDPPPGYAIPPNVPVGAMRKPLPKGVRSHRELGDMIRAYRGEVAYVAAQLDLLVERLKILGLLDRTVVIATSDHGEGLGDHGSLQHGHLLFDEIVRIPLVVRGPGFPAGRRLAGPAQLEDLTPTILHLMGVPWKDSFDGVDLLPWLRGETPESPRVAVLGRRRRYRNSADHYYVRSGSMKWIGELEGSAFVFDLEQDPRERILHHADEVPPPLLEALERATQAGEIREGSPIIDTEITETLEAMGYTED